ncbi:MAG: GNAT family N-acetyltransferase, partial [Acidobacteria bacterium]|nr:GNAT family N-acetyltransferase [Acidobacteriota bacterium]
LARMCFIDYAWQIALVAERRQPETDAAQIIAVGRIHKDRDAYARGRREAEFALVVSDRFQGQGLGKEMLRRLIEIAKKEDVSILLGEISAENLTMQGMCRKLGFELRREYNETTLVARMRL